MPILTLMCDLCFPKHKEYYPEANVVLRCRLHHCTLELGRNYALHCVPIKVGVTGGRMYMGTGVLIFLSFRISKLPARDEGNGMILRQSRYWSPYIPASDSNPESGQFEVTSFDLCKWTQLYWRQVLAPHPPRIKMILGEEHI